MGVKLRRDKVRIHLSGPWGEVDLRWTERFIGGGWNAEEQVGGHWYDAPQWHAVSRNHLAHHLAYVNRVARNA
jgi:hypothetical protein